VYLLVDSGSTKADWVWFDANTTDFFTSDGLNPSTQKPGFIENQITAIAQQCPGIPVKIFYYGAGTSSQSAKDLLSSIMNSAFPGSELSIHSDLLAAARALSQGKESIVCILGTGSNAALCDGHQIMHQLPSLGYILGDEGSGNHIGKEILRSYFYKKLDTALNLSFEQTHPEVKSDFIYHLYQSKQPSSKLASFAKFAIDNKNHPTLKNIITNCIEQFIDSKLFIYRDKSHLPVHVCGSIGYHLKDEFSNCLRAAGFTMGNCIQKPIQKLLEYHRNDR